jgi:hypothetical protein
LKFRWLTVAAALIAASAFALSVQAGRWWTIGEVEIGPNGSRSPFAGPGSLDWTGGSLQWLRFGKATWGAGLIAMFVLVVVAGGVAARRVPKLAAKTALVATLTAAATGVGFILTRPTNNMPFELDRGIPLFVAAIVVSLIVAIGVLRARPPAAPPA